MKQIDHLLQTLTNKVHKCCRRNASAKSKYNFKHTQKADIPETRLFIDCKPLSRLLVFAKSSIITINAKTSLTKTLTLNFTFQQDDKSQDATRTKLSLDYS